MQHRRPSFASLALVLVLACAVGAGCRDEAPQPPGGCGPEAIVEPDFEAEGPYRVGFRKLEVTYQPPGAESERTILVNLWYPTLDENGEGADYLGWFTDNDAWVDATPVSPASECGYPTLVYSHGHAGLGGGAAFLTRHFASHGWVAIAPDHTDNTIADNKEPRATSLYYLRALDVSTALDTVASLPEGDPLHARVAVDKVLLVGHSFGAHTAWSVAGARFDLDVIEENCRPGGSVPSGVCTEAELEVFASGVADRRVVAAVPMAGRIDRNWFGPAGHQSVEVPMMLLTGSEDDVGAEAQFETLIGVDLTWVDLDGGCHETFNLGFCNTLPRDEGYAITRAHALAFGRRHVLGDDAPDVVSLLDGTGTISDRTTFRRR